MNKVLALILSVVTAFVVLFMLSFLLVVLKIEGVLFMYFNAAIAIGAGRALYSYLNSRKKPK